VLVRIRLSLFCHYGSLDDRINTGIEAFESALRAASVDYGIYMHQGADHAFFNDIRIYNQALSADEIDRLAS